MDNARFLTLLLVALVTTWSTACNNESPVEEAKEAPQETETREFAITCLTPGDLTVTNPIRRQCTDELTSVFIDYELTTSGQEGCDLLPEITFERFNVGTNMWTDTMQSSTYPLNQTSVRVTARDRNTNDTVTATSSIDIFDEVGPEIRNLSNIEAECTSPEGTLVTAPPIVVVDACRGDVVQGPPNTAGAWSSTLNNPPIYAFGSHDVTVTAIDSGGSSSSSNYNIRIVDTTPPSVNAGEDFVVAEANNCDYTITGANDGTLVTLPLPTYSDACSTQDSMSILNNVTNSGDREVCLPAGATTVEWTAIDSHGLVNSDSVVVTVTPSTLTINLDAAPSGWTNDAGPQATATLSGQPGPVNWVMVGDLPPTTPPGNGTTASATFGNEGTYCPLYISAQAGGQLGTNQQGCFGVERSAPTGTFNLDQTWYDYDDPTQTVDIDPNDNRTWPIYFEGERIRAEISATDRTSDTRSGLARVQLVADPNTVNEQILIDWTGAADGTLPTGPMTMDQIGCNTDAPACDSVSRQIDLAQMATGDRELHLISTDFAGNTNSQVWYVRLKNYGGALDDIQELTQGLIDDPSTPPSARGFLTSANESFASAQRLFLNSPGYAFLLSRKAWRDLDEALANGADTDFVEFIQRLIARAIRAEVRRLVDATRARGFEDWNPLDDPERVNERYLSRPLLYGRENLYFVEVDNTINLAAQFVETARQKLDSNNVLGAIDDCIDAFDTLAILYDDETFAAAFNREANRLPNSTPERIFRGSLPLDWGLDIARSIVNQINRVSADPGVPAAARATLDSVKARMEDFERGVAQVGSPFYTNENFTRQIYMNAQLAIEEMRTIQESSVYTYYWQTGLAHVLLFIVNFSLYEGPTSIIPRLDGLPDDPDVQTSECRFDRGVQAIVDGRLDNSLQAALDNFQNSKCLLIQLYNRYWGMDGGFPRDNPIDPTEYGCSRDPVVVNVDEECECGIGTLDDTTCDGIDDDCDGVVDDDWVATPCGGLGPCGSVSQCVNGVELDCVPGEPLASVDLTCDGVDDDCDGMVDDDWVPETCGEFGCANTSACNAGVETECVPLEPGPEVCDGRDNNCNGIIDEGLDLDQDGFGPNGNEGCPGGTRRDCNDNNFFINPDAPEVCDNVDNDCDNLFDENVLNRCGNCRSSCTYDGYGTCDECVDFDPNPDNSDQVGVDPDGNLLLESNTIEAEFAWISNNSAGTVSKFDTTTGNEVGRYPTHINGSTGGNPSRTAIDARGNVYVGNRNTSYGLTKIGNWTELCEGPDLSLCECKDRNNNGTIETSRDLGGGPGGAPDGRLDDAGEYLGANDECLLWTSRTVKPNMSGNEGSTGTQGYIRGVAIDAEGYVWASDWHMMSVHKFDPETGAQVAWVQTSSNSYGLAIDALQRIWIAHTCCGSGGTIQYIDSTSVIDNGTGTSTNNKQFVSQRYTPPWHSSWKGGYGIAIDDQNRVWLGSYHRREYIASRFDPSNGSWTAVPSSCDAASGRGRGLTVSQDGDGNSIVWVAQHGHAGNNDCVDRGNYGGRVTGFRADQVGGNWQTVKDRNISSQCWIPVGTGVASGGFIWTVCQTSYSGAPTGRVYAMSPDPASNAFLTQESGGRTYTYSDFTGNLFRSFTAPQGDYTVVRRACSGTLNLSGWNSLTWNASVPSGAAVNFFVKTAATEAGLAGATEYGPFTQTSTGTASPIDLSAGGENLPAQAWFEIRVQLVANNNGATPLVSNFDITRYCE